MLSFFYSICVPLVFSSSQTHILIHQNMIYQLLCLAKFLEEGQETKPQSGSLPLRLRREEGIRARAKSPTHHRTTLYISDLQSPHWQHIRKTDGEKTISWVLMNTPGDLKRELRGENAWCGSPLISGFALPWYYSMNTSNLGLLSLISVLSAGSDACP